MERWNFVLCFSIIAFSLMIGSAYAVAPSLIVNSPANGSSIAVSSVNVDLTSSYSGGNHFTLLDDGSLSLWYRFDDLNSSGAILDLSGNGNNGTLGGNAAINSGNGTFGNGSYFDSVTDYVNIRNPIALNATQFTLSAWFRTDSLGTSQTLFHAAISGATDDVFYFRINTDNTIQLFNDFGIATGGGTVSLNKWHHAAVSLNNDSQLAMIYLDGVNVVNDTSFGMPSSDNLSYRLAIGNSRNDGFDQWPFNGSIDEAMIFNRSLNTSEIEALYNASVYQYNHTITGLVDSSTYNYKFYSVGASGEINNTERSTFTTSFQDLISPVLSYQSPTESDSTTLARNNIMINVSVVEDALANVTIFLYNESGSLINETTSLTSPNYVNITGLSDGTYYFNASAYDSSGNYGNTSTRTVTINTSCIYCVSYYTTSDEYPHNVKVVDYGNDMAWNGVGAVYRGVRNPEFMTGIDVDGDGDSSDDSVAFRNFSLTNPLNVRFPYARSDVESYKFYGGEVGYFVNYTSSDSDNYYLLMPEGGINVDHAARDDYNFHVYNATTIDSSLVNSSTKAYATWIWLKNDFLHGGADNQVYFDNESWISVFVSRHWKGLEEGRWVIRNGDQLYISNETFFNSTCITENGGPQTGNQICGAGGSSGGGKVHFAYPYNMTWGEYNPSGPYNINISADEMTFSSFASLGLDNITGAGFYVAKPSLDSPQVWLKFSAFELNARVNKSWESSYNLDMVEVPEGYVSFNRTSYYIPNLYFSKQEINYTLWNKIWNWADNNQYTRDVGYTFDRDGDMGSMDFGTLGHSPSEPVTDISWYDAVVWANALSEYEGRQPVYFNDENLTVVLRNSRFRDFRGNYTVYPDVYMNFSADGYRLPTITEWAYAYADSSFANSSSWNSYNSNFSSQDTGKRSANSFGLYDMAGNVWEWVWDNETDHYSNNQLNHVVLGGDFNYPNDPRNLSGSAWGDKPFDGNYNIGFRLVTRKDSLFGSLRGADRSPGFYTERGLPEWYFNKTTLTDANVSAQTNVSLDYVYVINSTFDPIDTSANDTLTISNLSSLAYEVPYSAWKQVYDWAIYNNYNFSNDGDMGSMDFGTFSHSPYEPVTDISWYDMVVWLNALSEMQGKQPVYIYGDSGADYKDAYKLVHPQLKQSAQSLLSVTQNFSLIERVNETLSRSGYRLPNDTEWEHFARGGTQNSYYWGSSVNDSYLWYSNNSDNRTHVVALKEPNSFGIYDSLGNVWEETSTAGPGTLGIGGKKTKGGSLFYDGSANSFSYSNRNYELTQSPSYPEMSFRYVLPGNISTEGSNTDLLSLAMCTDADGDGYGTGSSLEDCSLDKRTPDCDDSDSAVHPRAGEICTDGGDNDCDGLVDCDDVFDCGSSPACAVSYSCSLNSISFSSANVSYGEQIYLTINSSGCSSKGLSFYLYERDFGSSGNSSSNPPANITVTSDVFQVPWVVEYDEGDSDLPSFYAIVAESLNQSNNLSSTGFLNGTVIVHDVDRTDSDSDGVPDVFDDCPDTVAGEASDVSKRGCPKPDYSGLSVITDLDNQKINNLSRFEVSKTGYGSIVFGDANVSLVKNVAGVFRRVNLTDNMNISNLLVSVNSTALDGLNREATITLTNVTGITTPGIKRDGSACSDCSISSWTSSNGTLIFVVPHFTTYEVYETATESTDSSSPSSGAGYPAGWLKTRDTFYNLSDDRSFQESLSERERVSFVYDFEKYYVGVWDILSSGKEAEIRISPGEHESSMKKNQVTDFDLNSDGDNDVYVKIDEINRRRLTLSVGLLEGSLVTNESPEGGMASEDSGGFISKSKPYLVGILVLAVLVVIFLVIRRGDRPPRMRRFRG